MQRIAGMTVSVKANGIPEALYNGQRDKVVEAVKAEMARQKAALNAQMDSMEKEMAETIAYERRRADDSEAKRCELLADKMGQIKASMLHKRGLINRLKRTIENAWAITWATATSTNEILDRIWSDIKGGMICLK